MKKILGLTAAAAMMASTAMIATSASADPYIYVRDGHRDHDRGDRHRHRSRDRDHSSFSLRLGGGPTYRECRVFWRHGVRYRECWPASGGPAITFRF